MNMKQRNVYIMTAFALCLGVHEALAARLIRASVSYDGKVVLEGGTSDNGKSDADEVWGMLGTITFKPTEAFGGLGVAPTAQQATLADDRKGVAMRDTKLNVQIAYGGEANFRKLTLTRVPKDRWGGEWKLDQKEVDSIFGYRLISRREAAQLRKPKKLKP